jgi:hypothetical protein
VVPAPRWQATSSSPWQRWQVELPLDDHAPSSRCPYSAVTSQELQPLAASVVATTRDVAACAGAGKLSSHSTVLFPSSRWRGWISRWSLHLPCPSEACATSESSSRRSNRSQGRRIELQPAESRSSDAAVGEREIQSCKCNQALSGFW